MGFGGHWGMSLIAGLVRRRAAKARLNKLLPAIVLCALVLARPFTAAEASAPAMIVPGQFNVTDTGAFTYTIPIAVPPGTAGMAPAISLDYSNQNNNNGLVGAGWSISGLPSITRCPKTLEQEGVHGSVNYDGNDYFCLNGQQLIAESGNYGAAGTWYRTEIDGFTRVQSVGHVGTGPDHFVVWTKAGQIMEMGNTADSKGPLVPVACTYPQQTCASNDPNTVRVWGVNKISDTSGNYLTVTYNYGSPDAIHGEMFPTEIDYTANDAAGVSAYNSVRFSYTTSNNQVPVYQAGFLTETQHLLTDIQTYAGNYMVGDYWLGYNQAADSAHEDQLTSVTLCDHGGHSGQCLAPTIFTWQGGTVPSPTATAATLHGELHTVGRALNSSDYNNDGVVDATILWEPGSECPGSAPSVNYGNGDGTFTPSNGVTNYNPATNQDCGGQTTFLQEPNTILSDWNADGFSDVLEHQYNNNNQFTNNWYSLLNDGAGNLNTAQLLNLGTLVPQVADFFGNGQPAIYAQSTQAMWTNNGDGTFTSNNWSGLGIDSSNQTTLFAYDFAGNGCSGLMAQGNQTAVFYFCNAVLSELTAPGSGWDTYWHNGWRPTFADFNGDGKADVLWLGDNDKLRLWLSTGTGFVEKDLDGTISGVTNDTIVTGDWNGDGKTDIAVIPTSTSGNYSIWLSTGTSFLQGGGSASITNPNGRDINAYAADWNSDGGPDLWVQFADAPSSDTKYLYNFTPLRIYKISNGIGSTTTVQYDRLNSRNVYSRTRSVSYPSQDVDGPIYVVSKVSSSDGVNGTYNSTYAYQDLISDLRGRGMFGFGQMSVTDSQTGIIQTTTYGIKFPYAGLVATQTKVCPAAICGTSQDVAITSTANTYNTISKTAGVDPNTYYYDVELVKTSVASFDADGTQMPSVETDYNNYDSFGNPWEVVLNTMPPGQKNPNVTKTTENQYTNVTTDTVWNLGRLTSSTVTANYTDPFKGNSQITRSSTFAYGAGGILDQEIIEPTTTSCNGNNTACKLETDYQLDSFGHHQLTTVSGYGFGARQTETDYDYKTNYHGQFPTTVINNLGEAEFWAYDTKWGSPTSHTGPNGKTETWTPDTFGRPSTEQNVDNTYVNHSYAYCSGVNGGTDNTCPNNGAFLVTITTLGTDNATQIAPTKRIYYDALSREIADDVQGFDGSWIRVDTLYSHHGQIWEKSRPYLLSNPGSEVYDFYSSYDPLGRVLRIDHPDGSHTFYTYDGLTTTVADQYGDTTTTVKGDLGQVKTVKDPMGNTTSYAYDAYGELLETIDPAGNTASATYDLRGHKIASTDPDMGTWTYVYDAAGELLSQTDAKAQTVTMTYDGLGRMATRNEPDMTSSWTYGIGLDSSGNCTNLCNLGTYPYSAGRLVLASCSGSACGSGGSYQRAYTFTDNLQPYNQSITMGTSSYWARPIYDLLSGRIAKVRYFSGYTVDKNYNATGYLSQIADDATGFVIWQADSRDAELHLTASEMGAGIVKESQSFDSNTGRILNICASSNSGTCDGNLANMSYSWNKIGNLDWRSDNYANNTNPEYFCYDADSRLTAYGFGGTNCQNGTNYAVGYDALGNITYKTDINAQSCSNTSPCYLYGTNGVQPHAVREVIPCSTCTVEGLSGAQGNDAYFIYDQNGNLDCVTPVAQGPCNMSAVRMHKTWTSFNMASTVTQGGTTISFTYDPSHARASETDSFTGTITNYANYAEIGVMAERMQTGSTLTWRNYIVADGQMVAIRITAPGQNPAMYYPVLDHLGSMSALVDGNQLTQNGQANPHYDTVIDRYSYDAFGMARDPTNWKPLDCTKGPQPPFVRGFTGQEHLPENICLINLNARLYDPQIGRFLSPDPTVEAIYDGQDLNRYSYVGNNPLSFTDPSGLCFMGCFYKSPVFGAALDLGLFFFGLPELEVLTNMATIGGTATTAYAAASAAGLTVMNAGVAGGLSGAVTSGRLKGALLGAAQGMAEAEVGPTLHSLGTAIAKSTTAQFIAQGFVGGLFNIGHKGGFTSGFLAAGVGSMAAPIDLGEVGTGIEMASLGGAASVLGGGKFANGAATAAMSYAAGTLTGSEDVQVGGGSPSGETGDDAAIDRPTFAGVSTCGNSLCGNIPVNCSGGPCRLVMIDLASFASANSFNLTFSTATEWQAFWGHFFGGVLNVYFGGPKYSGGNEIGGEGCCGVLDLYGSAWESQYPSIVAHEFSHDLGLGHNSAVGTLMYPIIYSKTPNTLQPGERQTLLGNY